MDSGSKGTKSKTYKPFPFCQENKKHDPFIKLLNFFETYDTEKPQTAWNWFVFSVKNESISHTKDSRIFMLDMLV